jgi:glycosyltransferase involved in cell wall biosynthesis
VTNHDAGHAKTTDGPFPAGADPLLIATILRKEGSTGVQTHVQQLRRYLDRHGAATTLITPFSWGQALTVPVFGARLVLEKLSGSASVAWYRRWHEAFVRNALRESLAEVGNCVVYAQCPLSARAALSVRHGPHQRVIMAVHFRTSQADEWVNMERITRDRKVFRTIRREEREIIPQTDGLVFVSGWARDALFGWLPEAAEVPFAVIDNFVAPHKHTIDVVPMGDLVTIGHLSRVKNHRFMLQVLAVAKQAGRRYTLDSYGDGPLERELRQLADSLGLRDQIRFQGYRTDVRDFLPGYRAYVHASYSESSSLAIIEAMDAGLPIVAGKIGPIPELCEDGVEARFWPLDDPRRAAATLISLLDDEAERLKSADAARRRFQRSFDADVIAPRLLSFLADPSTGLSSEVSQGVI